MPQSTDFMGYVNRLTANQNNQEILTSYEWEIQFDHKPNIVFWPEDNLHKIRIKNVSLSGGEPTGLSQSTDLRGFHLVQPGFQQNSGSISISYQDFEDQAIAAMIQDWADKCNTRDTHRSAHKRDLYCDITLIRLNSFRKPVNQYICRTGIPDGGQYGDSWSESKSLMGAMGITIQFEFIQKQLLNLV